MEQESRWEDRETFSSNVLCYEKELGGCTLSIIYDAKDELYIFSARPRFDPDEIPSLRRPLEETADQVVGIQYISKGRIFSYVDRSKPLAREGLKILVAFKEDFLEAGKENPQIEREIRDAMTNLEKLADTYTPEGG